MNRLILHDLVSLISYCSAADLINLEHNSGKTGARDVSDKVKELTSQLITIKKHV